MPEIKRTFSAGRMNKDIDERLLPAGEYRDALNIGIGNSESSDIGALENLLGNELASADPFPEFVVTPGRSVYGFYGNAGAVVSVISTTQVQVGRTDVTYEVGRTISTRIPTSITSDDSTFALDSIPTTAVVTITNVELFEPGQTGHSGNTDRTETRITVDAAPNPGFEVGRVIYRIEVETTPAMATSNNATTIGAIRYDLEERVYWFVASEQGSFIMEYVEGADVIIPILSDTQGVLNFSTNNRITGINILGGILYWTDNNSEPKRININTFREATNGLYVHTQLYGRNFIEDDITVIKKSPLNAPNVDLFETLEGGGGNYNAVLNFDFSKEIVDGGQMDIIPFDPGDTGTVVVSGMNLEYRAGDTVKLTGMFDPETSPSVDLEVTITLTSVIGLQWEFEVNTISSEVPDSTEVLYTASLADAEVLFELKFPRFAYRWKYVDGEYSTFSPFSEVAFRTGPYSYNSEEGYNLAMTNTIRRVRIDGFDQAPDDVVEVDVLYTESNRTQIYTVETIPVETTRIEVTRDQIHALLPENQILRPYDNVPKLAKSQEVTANRLVYGNYVHNYDVNSEPEFMIQVEDRINNNNSPNRSLKTIRDYQFGVVYKDKYGRETPVLSNTTGGVNIPLTESANTNAFSVSLNNEWPNEDFTHYKYYIKETSQEYYNLALDRFYDQGDGFIWLSFPSSEFNKVNEDDYIYLKKGHTTERAVTAADARYKVLDVQTEAPDFLQRVRQVRGNIPYSIGTSAEYDTIPEEAGLTFDMVVDSANSLRPLIAVGNYIRFRDGSNVSNQYEITASVEGVGSNANNITISVNIPFGTDVDFVENPNIDPDDQATFVAPLIDVEISEEVIENSPDFIGRFFVKTVINGTFISEVVEPSKVDVEPIYGVVEELDQVYQYLTTSGGGDGFYGQNRLFWDFRNRMWSHRRGYETRPDDGVGIQQGSNRIDLAVAGFGRVNPFASQTRLHDFLAKTGTFLRFTDATTGDPISDTVFMIQSVSQIGGYNGQDPCDALGIGIEFNCNSQMGYTGNGQSGTADGWLSKSENASNHFKRWEITLDKPIDFAYTGASESVSRDVFSREEGPIGFQILQDVSSIGSTDEGGSEYTSNPAIFETEPRGDDLLDIYYETQETFTREDHGQVNRLRWYNCFSFGNGVESNRIRDDFNAVQIDRGPRVSTTIAEQFREEHRPSGLIWSGIFNTTTGINNTNQFILAEGIQKELQPQFGSIQKLHSRNTDLITFCEDKVVRILADKDALFNADGSTNLSGSNNVLGQTVPYTGEYGISKNPESFTTYGSRIYFADRNRGVILRLSQDGLTEISSTGIEDFIRDTMRDTTGPIIGSYDEYHDLANFTFDSWSLSYDEHTKGWPSRKSFVPEAGLTLNNRYYTWKNGSLYEHNSRNVPRNNFYGTQYNSAIVFIFNDEPSSVKNFKTINYEGTQPKTVTSYDLDDNIVCRNTVDGGWFCPTFITDQQIGDGRSFINKEGKWFLDIGVLGGAESIIAVNDTFDNIDGDGSEGPLLDDDEIMDGLDGDLGDEDDNPFDDLGDGDGIGCGDEIEEVDENGDPIDPEDSESEVTITLTLE